MKKLTYYLCVHFVVVIFLIGSNLPSNACSRALFSSDCKTVLSGRNMDWSEPMSVNLWALPRGIARNGLTGTNTLKWSAKYGSVVVADYVPYDGINEKGLSAHVLWLSESDYGQRDETVPGLKIGLWVQFFVDNFSTVDEAVSFTQKTPFQLVTATVGGNKINLHMVIEDSTGDSAIIEYIDGKPKVYHDKKYKMVTNSPTFDKQIDNLKNYMGFGGKNPLPGSTESADRFVRGAYYLEHLPRPADNRQCLAGIKSVMDNVAQPLGVKDPLRPFNSATQWRTFSDLTNKIYYFGSSYSFNTIWVVLGSMDFTQGTSTKMYDVVKGPDRTGDVSKFFKNTKPIF